VNRYRAIRQGLEQDTQGAVCVTVESQPTGFDGLPPSEVLDNFACPVCGLRRKGFAHDDDVSSQDLGLVNQPIPEPGEGPGHERPDRLSSDFPLRPVTGGLEVALREHDRLVVVEQPTYGLVVEIVYEISYASPHPRRSLKHTLPLATRGFAGSGQQVVQVVRQPHDPTKRSVSNLVNPVVGQGGGKGPDPGVNGAHTLVLSMRDIDLFGDGQIPTPILVDETTVAGFVW
jgi:hypothetical protein